MARLIDLRAGEAELPAVLERAGRARRVVLAAEAEGDLEALALGALAPLDRYVGRADAEAVDARRRLADGTPCPRAPRLEVDAGVRAGEDLALCDDTGVILGLLAATETFDAGGRRFAAGRPILVQRPKRADFVALRRTPAETAAELARRGIARAALVEARGLLLGPDVAALKALLERDADGAGGVVLWIAAGKPLPGDREHFLRVRCALKAARAADPARVLAVVSSSVPRDGETGALELARIAASHGCASAVVAPGFADALAAEAKAIGAALIAQREFVFAPERGALVEREQLALGEPFESANAADVERRLERGESLPRWIADFDLADLLRAAHPPKTEQGVTIWLTGLSQSGKSTIANLLAQRLLEYGRASSLLDGDVVRTHLSKGLGFSREDREANMRRLGFIAGEITRHGGTTIVATIAPYATVRAENRERIGNYVEVYVNAPLAVCAARDQKGQYEKALAGEITGFTGVDDPYEPPDCASGDCVECRTDLQTPEQSADAVVEHLVAKGYLGADRA